MIGLIIATIVRPVPPAPRRRANTSSLRPVPVPAVCHECGATFNTRSFIVDACHLCGSADVTILTLTSTPSIVKESR